MQGWGGRTSRAGIENNRIAGVTRPYRLKPVSMGDVTGPYDLDKALQLADHLEDEEIARKLLLNFKRFPGVDHVNPLEEGARRRR